MFKRYLKTTRGETAITYKDIPPYYHSQPSFLRNRDWYISGMWYTNVGKDLLDSVNPFSDNSLIHKWSFNNIIKDVITNKVIILSNAKYVDGMFNSSLITILIIKFNQIRI